MNDTQIGSNWTVLIVDDQLDNIKVAETIFEFYGARVIVAGNGKEGLDMVDEIVPTVILLDLSMPVMDGWEMFKQLRQRDELNHVPIIVVTAHAMDGDRSRVLAAGFDDYISKPYDIQEFVARVQSVVEQKACIKDV